jgi:hypothetical protein
VRDESRFAPCFSLPFSCVTNSLKKAMVSILFEATAEGVPDSTASNQDCTALMTSSSDMADVGIACWMGPPAAQSPSVCFCKSFAEIALAVAETFPRGVGASDAVVDVQAGLAETAPWPSLGKAGQANAGT